MVLDQFFIASWVIKLQKLAQQINFFFRPHYVSKMRWKYRIIGSATLASRFQVLFLGFSDKRKSDYLAVHLRVRLRLKMILRHFFASGLGHPVPEVIRIRISGFEITANFKLTNNYSVSKYFSCRKYEKNQLIFNFS